MRNKRMSRLTGITAAALVGATVFGTTVFAAPDGMQRQTQDGQQRNRPEEQRQGGQQSGRPEEQTQTTAEEPSEIVTSTVENTAQALTADMESAAAITMSEENSQVKISSEGTYIVTGTCADGNITVKKGTTGVVLVLKDLDLTSTTGAAVSLNKGSEVKVIIEGTVKLTDAEDPADEDSADADVADAFDGAALKAKSGSNVYLTGSGTLTIDASSCKNGIKVGDSDDGAPSFVIDGPAIVITAANDGMNAGYDLTVLSGDITINAGDDGIHADRILTVGKSDGSGPDIVVQSSVEGLEGTVVNIFGGTVSVTASDDGINAANSDGTFSSEMDFSINITGGTVTVNAGGDGLDSNGNVNLTGGCITIKSASNGGEAGIDYDGSLYISDEVQMTNASGVSGADGMPGGGRPEARNTEEMPGERESAQQPAETTPVFGWSDASGDALYWYEDGIRQGTAADDKCFSYDGTLRGREIYDPVSDGWYWLDVDADGARAVGKEVFMPYIYQEEAGWDDGEIQRNAAASDDGLQDYVQACIQNGTGKWVRYDQNGKMLKGWVTIGEELEALYPEQAGNTYYYDTKTGLMAKGAVTIGGVACYFDETTGVLQK